MTDKQKALAATVLAVAALGAAVFYATQADDDDRPPIIVKGGSLYFDSGEDGNAHRPRRNWKKDTATGEYSQDDAKHVKFFQVYFVGGKTTTDGPCAPRTAENFDIRFDHDNSPDTALRTYSFKIVNNAPTVSGEGLSGENTYRLTAEATNGAKTITSVDFANWKCLEPTAVWVESGWKKK